MFVFVPWLSNAAEDPLNLPWLPRACSNNVQGNELFYQDLYLRLFSKSATSEEESKSVWEILRKCSASPSVGQAFGISLLVKHSIKSSEPLVPIEIADWFENGLKEVLDQCLKMQSVACDTIFETAPDLLFKLKRIRGDLPSILNLTHEWVSKTVEATKEIKEEKLQIILALNIADYVLGFRQRNVELFNRYKKKLLNSKNALNQRAFFENVCTSLRDIGKNQDCFSLISELKAINPNIDLDVELAITNFKSGKTQEAISIMGPKVNRGGDQYSSFFKLYLAYFYLSLENMEKASSNLDDLEAETKGLGERVQFFTSQARLQYYLQSGDDQKFTTAKNKVEQLLSDISVGTFSDSPKVYFLSALFYLKKKKGELAKKALQSLKTSLVSDASHDFFRKFVEVGIIATEREIKRSDLNSLEGIYSKDHPDFKLVVDQLIPK